MAIIYGLFDPRRPLLLWEVRYLGRSSTTPTKRLYGHLATARKGTRTPVNYWIRKLLAENITPHIHTLETTDNAVSGKREIAWIAEGRRQGWRLLNVSDGGDGQSVGFKFSDEQRRALSETVIQRHLDDPGIAERKRDGQMRRYSNPEERRITGEKIAEAIANSDKSDKWCSDCGEGPFRGTWGLAAHRSFDHDPQPEMCPECDEGPFVGRHGVIMHQMHKHDNTKEPLICECGEGPFDGTHGLGIHMGRFCLLLHSPDEREAWSQRLTEIYADNAELRGRIGRAVKASLDAEDKTPTTCPCGAGPFIGPRAVQLHQTKTQCQIPEKDHIVRPIEIRGPQSDETKRKISDVQKNNKRQCIECGLISNGGALSSHQRRSGHTGIRKL